MNTLPLDKPSSHVPDAQAIENGQLPNTSGLWTCGRHNTPWHVIWTKPGQEHIADRELRAAGFPTFFPLYGARRAAYVPMFRRYGFAQPNRDDQWVGMLYARGVAAVLRTPYGVPQVVPQRNMDELFAQCSPNGVIFEPEPRRAQKGDPVRVLEGPLAGFTGICARTSAERVWLLLTLLGRSQEVSFTHHAVEAATKETT